MATKQEVNQTFLNKLQRFPPILDGKIDINQFLKASTDLVTIVERLGTIFAPVKYDMQGNINKIQKCYECQKNSCLLELMITENDNGQAIATEGVLWLNRALLFFEIVFQQIIQHLQSNNYDISTTKIFTVAYEGSVKKYHNLISQKLFALICKMSPALPQIMKSLEVANIATFETDLTTLNISLSPIRCKIDEFFKENNLLKKMK